jgi:diacylglycerol O-acyltransferase / wax synthase
VAEELRYEDRMSDADALMWTIEKDPLLRTTITALSVLDRPPDPDLLAGRLERATRLIPRLRQRVVGNPFSLAPPRWELDPNFDVRYHVRHVRVPGAGTDQDVLELAEWVAMGSFDRARPLWEFYVVDGVSGGRGALIQKIHHTVTDGLGSIKMALTIFDLERDAEPDGDLPELPDIAPLGPLERVWDGLGHVGRRQAGILRRSGGTIARGLRHAVADPVGTARGATETASSVGRLVAPVTHPMSPIMTQRSLSVRFATLCRPVDDLKRAAKAADARLNDAYVTAVARAMHRYHDRRGAAVPMLRMTMPINTRDESTDALAGNRFVPARFPIPVDIADPVEHMAAIHGLVDQQRAEPSLAFVDPLAGLLNRLPATVTTSVFGGMLKCIDFVTTNVPGAPIPLYVAGAQILEQYPFAPLSGASANIALLSWLDQACIGINTDQAAVDDPLELRALIEESLDEVIACG